MFYDGGTCVEIGRRPTPSGRCRAHGSGCTHSPESAGCPAGLGDDAAAECGSNGPRMVSAAIADGLREIGQGAGPVNVLAQEPRSFAPPNRMGPRSETGKTRDGSAGPGW